MEKEICSLDDDPNDDNNFYFTNQRSMFIRATQATKIFSLPSSSSALCPLPSVPIGPE